VSVKVNAVVYYRVIDPEKAIIQVEDYNQATSELAQTTLRSVVGQHELDQMLAERDKLNADVQKILDSQTDAWGIKVSNVELKHIDLDEQMIRAIAKQAEAERLRRAKIIDAAKHRPPNGWSRPARCFRNIQNQCSSDIWEPSQTSPGRRVRPSSSRCRSNFSIWCAGR